MKIIIVVLAFLLYSQLSLASDNTKTVEHFIQAFNQHDVDKMLSYTTDNIRWMSVADDQLSTQTSSKKQLREAMSDYFKSTPSTHSKVRSIKQSDTFVYTVEQAFWISAGVEKSQCSLAVYQLKEKKIANVWYFAEHSCD
jgi:hypothetical protein